MIILLLALLLCGIFVALSLCQAAHRGDQMLASALGVDLAEPNYRTPSNRRGHRLAHYLALSHAEWRLA